LHRSTREPLVNDEQSVPDVGDLSVVRLLLESAGPQDDGEQEATESS